MSVYVKPPINQPPVAKGGLFSFGVIYHVLLKKYLSTKKLLYVLTSLHNRNCYKIFSDRFEYLIRFLKLEVGHIGSKQISFNYLLINNDW